MKRQVYLGAVAYELVVSWGQQVGAPDPPPQPLNPELEMLTMVKP